MSFGNCMNERHVELVYCINSLVMHFNAHKVFVELTHWKSSIVYRLEFMILSNYCSFHLLKAMNMLLSFRIARKHPFAWAFALVCESRGFTSWSPNRRRHGMYMICILGVLSRRIHESKGVNCIEERPSLEGHKSKRVI